METKVEIVRSSRYLVEGQCLYKARFFITTDPSFVTIHIFYVFVSLSPISHSIIHCLPHPPNCLRGLSDCKFNIMRYRPHWRTVSCWLFPNRN